MRGQWRPGHGATTGACTRKPIEPTSCLCILEEIQVTRLVHGLLGGGAVHDMESLSANLLTDSAVISLLERGKSRRAHERLVAAHYEYFNADLRASEELWSSADLVGRYWLSGLTRESIISEYVHYSARKYIERLSIQYRLPHDESDSRDMVDTGFAQLGGDAAIILALHHGAYFESLRQAAKRHLIFVARPAFHDQLYAELLTSLEVLGMSITYGRRGAIDSLRYGGQILLFIDSASFHRPERNQTITLGGLTVALNSRIAEVLIKAGEIGAVTAVLDPGQRIRLISPRIDNASGYLPYLARRFIEPTIVQAPMQWDRMKYLSRMVALADPERCTQTSEG